MALVEPFAIGVRLPATGGTGPRLAASGQMTEAMTDARAVGELIAMRAERGLQSGSGTLARLDVGGRSFYGINAHRQPVTMRVNAITRTHAEAHAFQQAANAGIRAERGTLYVDRAL